MDEISNPLLSHGETLTLLKCLRQVEMNCREAKNCSEFSADEGELESDQARVFKSAKPIRASDQDAILNVLQVIKAKRQSRICP